MSEEIEKPIETRSAYYVYVPVTLAVLANSDIEAIEFAKNSQIDRPFISSTKCTLFAIDCRFSQVFIERITPPASPESQKRYNDWYEANRHLNPMPPEPPGIWD